MSLHIGVHWNIMIGMYRRQMGSNSRGRTILLRIAAVLAAGYGVYAFLHREIGTYMVLKTAFVFFDFEKPLALFFLDYLAVMELFVVIGYIHIGLTQQDTRCSDSANKARKNLMGMASAVETETKFVEIRLELGAAAMISA